MAEESKAKRLDTALKRFKLAVSDTEQRERDAQALKFAAGDQWPDWVRQQRKGDPPGTPNGVGARPCLTIDQLTQPVAQVVNAQKNAHLAVKLIPKQSNPQSRKVADVREGLIRNIQVESRAGIAMDWAFERAAECGRGYFEVRKVWADDPQHPFDQNLIISRILRQDCIAFDPFAEQPDYSDADYAFKWVDMPEARFERDYPKAKLSSAGGSELQALSETYPSWVAGDEEARTYRVAEYWYASYDKGDTYALIETPQGDQVVRKADVPEGASVIQERTVWERSIDWCKITCNEILEETPWDGQYIPIIPVIWKERNLNGRRMWSGIVNSSAQDAQQGFNFMWSAAVETWGLAPKAPRELDPGQIEGFEQFWNQANTRNFPYLPRRSFEPLSGRPYLPIEHNQFDLSKMNGAMILLSQAKDNVHATTGVPPVALGNLDPHERSGKAIRALQQVSDQGSSNGLDNLATISLTFLGMVLNDLLEYVYDRPGRVARILGDEDEPSDVILNQPFTRDPQSGQAQPVPQTPGQPMPPNTEFYNLSEGEFAVTVSVGKSTNSRREETASAIAQLLDAAPQMAPMISDIWVGNMDFPGAQKIADRLKMMLPPQLQQQVGQQDPKVQLQQLQGQMQQAAKQIELLTKVTQEQQEAIQRETWKEDAETKRLAMKLQSEEKRSEQQTLAKLADTEAKVNAQGAQAMVSEEYAAISGHLDRIHEMLMLQHQSAQQGALSAQEHGQNLEAGEQAGDQQLASQAQQAALQPPAQNGGG